MDGWGNGILVLDFYVCMCVCVLWLENKWNICLSSAFIWVYIWGLEVGYLVDRYWCLGLIDGFEGCDVNGMGIRIK
jgi:hypothetical protein